MSFEKITKILIGDSPGKTTELNYFRIGPAEPEKKVYLQAALHADEQPGIMILHHMLELLKAADQAGELGAQFVLLPMVNPLGMGDIEFGQHQGRYDRDTGINHNRQWPDLYSAVDKSLGDRLGSDEKENIRLVRGAVAKWLESYPQVKARDQWRHAVVSEATTPITYLICIATMIRCSTFTPFRSNRRPCEFWRTTQVPPRPCSPKMVVVIPSTKSGPRSGLNWRKNILIRQFP